MAKPSSRPKRSKKVVEADGVAHIKATFNNTAHHDHRHAGNAIVWASAGKAGFKGSKKSTPFAATVAGEQVGREAVGMGVKRVDVRVQGPGSGRESAIQALAAAGLDHQVDPRRDAASAQRLPSPQEAPGLRRSYYDYELATPDPSASSAAAKARSCS